MTRYSEPFLLSSKGSTRATAYCFSNKCVTLDEKTHVFWLDAVAQICARTYDHGSGAWGETVELFEGCDNHTTPAVIVDSEGRVHMVYGPHGWWGGWNSGCFKHTVTESSGDVSTWTDADSFGYNSTYASPAMTPSGLLGIAYRGGDPPSPLMFQRQREIGGWKTAQPLMRQDIPPQYTHVGATLVCDGEGTLYAGGHFFNTTDGFSPGVAVLKSVDSGESWTNLEGETAKTPVLLDDRFAVPQRGEGDVRLDGMALDSRGRLWVSSSGGAYAQVSVWRNGWETTELNPFLPGTLASEGGPITIDTEDRIHLTVSLNRPMEDRNEGWGHPGLEVFHLMSEDDGVTFECNQISPDDNTVANWLPAISLGGIHQPVESPTILYTRGVPGDGCSPTTQTEVYCVRIEEIE